MIRMFFYSGVQAAISFSYVVSVTSRAFEFIDNGALYIFGVWFISEMKQFASVVFQLPINLQGDFYNGLIFRMKLLVSLVPYLPRKVNESRF